VVRKKPLPTAGKMQFFEGKRKKHLSIKINYGFIAPPATMYNKSEAILTQAHSRGRGNKYYTRRDLTESLALI